MFSLRAPLCLPVLRVEILHVNPVVWHAAVTVLERLRLAPTLIFHQSLPAESPSAVLHCFPDYFFHIAGDFDVIYDFRLTCMIFRQAFFQSSDRGSQTSCASTRATHTARTICIRPMSINGTVLCEYRIHSYLCASCFRCKPAVKLIISTTNRDWQTAVIIINDAAALAVSSGDSSAGYGRITKSSLIFEYASPVTNTLLSSALASIPPSARWNIVFCIVSYPFACCFSPLIIGSFEHTARLTHSSVSHMASSGGRTVAALCIYESANPPADYSYHTLLNKYTEQLLQNHTMERKKAHSLPSSHIRYQDSRFHIIPLRLYYKGPIIPPGNILNSRQPITMVFFIQL